MCAKSGETALRRSIKTYPKGVPGRAKEPWFLKDLPRQQTLTVSGTGRGRHFHSSQLQRGSRVPPSCSLKLQDTQGVRQRDKAPSRPRRNTNTHVPFLAAITYNPGEPRARLLFRLTWEQGRGEELRVPFLFFFLFFLKTCTGVVYGCCVGFCRTEGESAVSMHVPSSPDFLPIEITTERRELSTLSGRFSLVI